MKYSDFDKRTYAKWTDVTTPVVAMIEELRIEEMSQTKEQRLVAYFPKEQFRYGVPLNKTNRDALRLITGSDDPQDAVGTLVELYNDPTIRNPRTGEYGSVRIRRAPVKRKPVPLGLRKIAAEQAEKIQSG